MTDAIPLWLPILSYEGLYEVSHRGQVRSLDRIIYFRNGRSRFFHGQVLAQSQIGRGRHLAVHLWHDGRRQTRYVHHLVLEAFDRPMPPGLECRHGPGGRLNNRWPEAICWGTKIDNLVADKERDGTLLRGERHGQAKLTEAIVLECRQRRAAGQQIRALAREFRVHEVTMLDAIRGKTWSHV